MTNKQRLGLCRHLTWDLELSKGKLWGASGPTELALKLLATGVLSSTEHIMLALAKDVWDGGNDIDSPRFHAIVNRLDNGQLNRVANVLLAIAKGGSI